MPVHFQGKPAGHVVKATITKTVTAPVHHKKKGRKLKGGSKVGVVSLIKKVLNGTLETKYNASQNQNISFNSAISSFTEGYPMLPPVPLTTGSDSSSRQGYEIEPTQLRCSLTVALPNVQRSNALRVDVYVLTRKANKYWPTVSTLSGKPQLFMAGNPAPGGKTADYTGYLCQRFLKSNSSEFTVLRHLTFVLGGNVGFPNGDTTAGNSPNMSIDGMQRSITMKLPCPKTLKYDLNSATATNLYPNNYAPFMFIGYSKVDGSAPDSVLTSIIASWTLGLDYKDA